MSLAQCREERRNRKKYTQEKLTVYDDSGRMRDHDYADICDCMSDDCIGCWGLCPKCKIGCKCGPVCRKNRNFYFESISVDGKEELINNIYAQ